ncbi:phytanoyl-CoA dioxygenase family protein [Candidatus Njordibacter sp. Uisw_058]|uniref:phytanoyl-CoA dioxygenase family protein n=1 Tax=Candidatus Njordibacter sp. Uisw_058 TaxID=3230974 RepID=UPI003D45EFBF
MPITDILTQHEIDQFKVDGAVFLKGKFSSQWIEELTHGIDANMKHPSPRFARHTKDDDAPGYFEDFWIWDCHQGFENFVFQSPAAKIAAELLSAKKINLVMDNWFFREAGSKSGAPFHHDISYFDFEGSMCVLWLPLGSVKKHEGIAWIKGSHLWNKLFLRTRFKDGHQEDGEAGEVNSKSYHLTPDILNNKQDYEFLAWDFELGDCVFFDMRTRHGSLNQVMPGKNVHRYTLRMAKEGSKVGYRGACAQAERTIMEANGYQNGDELSGKMFPTLYEN